MDIKFFDKWSTEGIEVKEPGLKRYINVSPILVPKTHGRHSSKQFYKSGISLVERLMNHMMTPGHRGKRQVICSRKLTGKTATIWKATKEAFTIIENKLKKNPIEVLVRAVENAALREEVTSFRLGGIVGRKAVISSPQRRIDLALRLITQASFQKSHGKGKKIANVLAAEIIACYENDASKATAIREKERIEREAAGSR